MARERGAAGGQWAICGVIGDLGRSPTASYSRIRGANDAIQLGLIGCGGRGKSVTGTFVKNSDVRLTALCDVWGDRVDEAAEKTNAHGAKKFGDHRKLLDQAQVDAV